MIEIKFRLIENNKLVGYEMFMDGKWVYSLPDENFSLYTECVPHDLKNQYTGLKDKNGVEVYEGDIVKAFNNSIGEIIFYNGNITIDMEFYFNSGFAIKYSYGIEIIYINNIEVIGNIYENPELLEDK